MSSSSSSAPSVTYSSTRGGQSHLDFGTVVLQGLARDRGLFVPDTIPTLEQGELESWRSMSFPQLTVQILQKFIGDDQVPRADLERIVHTSCDSFRHSNVTPVKMVNGHAVLVSNYEKKDRPWMGCLIILFRGGWLLTLCVKFAHHRNSFMAPPLPSRTWPSKCWATFLNTFSKRGAKTN